MTLAPGDLLTKDPNASQDPRGMDWTAYLAEISTTETIADSQWEATGKDALLLLSDSSIITGQKMTQVRLAGGTPGVRYTLTNRITTSSGVIDDRSFKILVQQL